MSKTGFKGGRLGIGTDDPIYPLDVVGDIRLTGGFRDASGNDFNFIALAGPDIVRTSDLADSITGIICKDNCVGIFNNNPSQSLDVSGNIRLTGDLLDANGAARVFSNWTVDGTNIFRNSKVTIGDNSVNTNYSLYVNGHVKFSETNVSKLKNHLSSGTGIWYDYANIQRFIINNEEKMRIHSDGNVGIGTADPGTYKLKVNGKGYFSQIDLPGGDIQEQINGKQIKLSPTVRLNASYIGDNDDVSNTEYGYLNGVTSSIQTQLNGKLDKTSRATSAAKVFLNHGVNTNSNNSVLTANIGGNGDYFIYTNSPFCFNTNSGNVGIGTTSPQAPLHIVDKDPIASASEVLRLQRGDSTHSDITTASKGSIGMYLVDSNNGGGEVAKIEWRHDGTNSSSEGLGTLSFWTSNTGGVDGVPEERMTIRASGNVGIGTTTPQTALDVAGDYSKDGEIISMSSQYGLNAKSSIFNDWFREEHSNWGLYWINNIGTYGSLDYTTLVPNVTSSSTSNMTSTGVTGKSISSLMSTYSPGDRGERIGIVSRTIGSYNHTTFRIHMGYWANGHADRININADPWTTQPDYTVGSGTTVDVMLSGYIKCNQTGQYYFAAHQRHYYKCLLFIQSPEEGTGTMWGFGSGGNRYNHYTRTDAIDMTAGKYYKFVFCLNGSGYYYYSGAGCQLAWTTSGHSTTNYYSSGHTPSSIASTSDIDGITNWETRFGWISDDSPLQFIRRIPN